MWAAPGKWLGAAALLSFGLVAFGVKVLACTPKPTPERALGLSAPGSSLASSLSAASSFSAAPGLSSAVPATAQLAATDSRRSYNVAVVGDSLTAFKGRFRGYVGDLAERCPQSRFDNYGIGGQMTNQMRRRFQRDVLGPDKPRYTDVIIFGGVNDLYSDITAQRSNERIQADLAQMYRWAKDAGLRTIALTVAPWGGFHKYFTAERGKHSVALNHWIVSNSKLDTAPPLLDVVVQTGPLLSCGNSALLCPKFVPPFNDGLHFGPAAHRLLAEAVQRAAFSDCR